VELNIGHSIVSRAVMTGLEAAVKEMLALNEKLSRMN
jgi:pyridoxine 5'-phosphate synthase PdxJ